MSEQPGRYQRSPAGMVGALLVLLLAIGAFVGFRALTRDELEVEPERVDYLAAVEAAQSEDWDVAYPPTLPSGWRATSIDATAPVDWGLGFLPRDGFAGVRQSDEPLSDLLETYVDAETTSLPAVEVPGDLGGRWEAFEDAEGDLAYATEVGDQTLLVYGSASDDDLLGLAERLTTDPVS
ncbi:DUF4245 family protein [Nocardioides sp. GXQ0305]|uniref:DUF4245 family protein n=1 Tax=Nocardioides sp. GXQ0305 TaxID=3423912 RepID=UPI003D7EB64E